MRYPLPGYINPHGQIKPLVRYVETLSESPFDPQLVALFLENPLQFSELRGSIF